jgi:hypothetical protein
MTKLVREMLEQKALELAEQGFINENQLDGLLNKQMNKGIIAEGTLVTNLNIRTSFDNKQGEDLIYRGIKVQFKFMGFGSSPSVTETKKQDDEEVETFVDRILKKYNKVDEFWIYADNDLELDLNKMYMLTREQFKRFLFTQNIKNNKKIRLVGKRILRSMFTQGL